MAWNDPNELTWAEGSPLTSEGMIAYVKDNLLALRGHCQVIAEARHLSKTSVRLQLKRLEGAGRIQRGLGHRNIQLTDVRE